MKVFVDFDDVIFHAKKFKEDLIHVFIKNGITRHEFENSYYTFSKRVQEYGQHYDPKKQVKVLKKRFKIDQKKLEKDIDNFLKNLKSYVFPDVYDFLKSFNKNDLFLVSYGHAWFQRKKIKGAKIDKFFRRVLITKNNKLDIILDICRKYRFSPSKEDIILIDDRPEQLERIEKKKRKIRTFRLCRPQGRYSDLICIDKDYEVKNLKEVAKIIKSEGMK